MNPIQLAELLGDSGLRMIEQVYSHFNTTDTHEAMIRGRPRGKLGEDRVNSTTDTERSSRWNVAL